jgi:hypothetical protein
MTHPDSPPGGGPGRDGVNLRLLWPQWQGAGTSSVSELAPEFPFDVAQRGYCSRRLSRPAGSPWPGCTPGPRTTSRT